jgi:hypothetical protein
MRLPPRDLTEDAEPVSPSTLTVGETYFILQFVDGELYIPKLMPIVFIGSDLEPSDVGLYYFQDAESHRAGARYGCLDDEYLEREPNAEIHLQQGTELNHIFEFERALDQLLVCDVRRRRARKKQ